MNRLTTPIFVAAFASAAMLAAPALADRVAASVVIKDHVFDPMEIKVPAGVEIELTIDNQDATPEEIEQLEIGVEKIIPGNSKGKVRFGPLEAGNSYLFIGEFNQSTARGVITVE